MEIAFLSFFNGLSNRGAETFVHELASRLANDFSVVVYQNGKALPNTPYTVKYLPSLQSLPEFSPHPDILIPTNGRTQSLLSRIWAARHNAKIIISGQSGIGFDDRLNLYTFPNVFVALTNAQADWAKKANPKVKVVTIANGVDLDKFKASTKPLPIDLPRPLALYVAALEPIKRHHLLIDAVAQTDCSLLLAGQGSLENEIRDYAQAKLKPEKFKIMDLPYSQMPGIYPACDVFVYPTAPWESFGIAILEALASGRPVVATDDPIRKEIVGPGGLLADPTQPDQFARAMSQCLKTDWGDKPRTQAAKFSWNIIADMYRQLCTSL